MTVIDLLLEIARRNREREFLVDTVSGQMLTFGGLHEAAIRVGADLRRRGLRRGDRIAILLHNSAEFAKLYFGCLYAGLVAVPVNPVLVRKELEHIVGHSGARLLVVSPETILQIDRDAMSEAGLETLVLLDKRTSNRVPTGIETWDLDTLPDANGFTAFEGVSADDTMAIVYTSGTTAMPSGVVHRISNMVENARAYNSRLGIGPENRFYGILAMTNLPGYYNLLILPYVAEASVVLANAFDARSAFNFWEPVRQHGVNTLWFVPTIMSILMEMDRASVGESLCRDQVRLALVGTAPLADQLRHDFESRYGITVYENYALSETLFITTNAPSRTVLDGSVGRSLPEVQVRIIDEASDPLASGEEGEICVQTPVLFIGYHDPAREQPDLFRRDDWFPTGDIGILSPEGALFVTGRKKDLIIRGGINISPAMIENVLYQHPAVIECAVVGIPHAHYGEDVAAAVRLSGGYELDEVREELVELCKENLATIRRPARILEVTEFPHSSSGKIQKGKVRALLTRSFKADIPLE